MENGVSIITGASSGIGRSIAIGLARAGGGLVILGRNEARLRDVERECKKQGAKVTTFATDFAADRSLKRSSELANAAQSGVNALIHCAGEYLRGSTDEIDAEQFERLHRVNVVGPYELTRLLLPALRRARGTIVFISSSVIRDPSAGLGAYAASKAAASAMAKAIRAEVNSDGVRVVEVFVGRCATPMQEEVHRIEGRPYDPAKLIQPEHIANLVSELINLPESSEVTEISVRPSAKL